MKQEVKIGIVVTLSIVVLIWGLSYLKGNDLFQSDNYFYATFDDVQGIKKSAPIMLNGFQIGYVRKITLSEKNSKLLMELSVLEKYSILKNSKALIYSTDLMGTKAVKIVMGKSAEKMESGDTIQSGIEGDMLAELMPLKDQLSTLLVSVDTILQDVHALLDTSTQGDIKEIIKNLNSTSSSINSLMLSEKQRLKSILSNIDSITSMFKNNSKQLSNAMSNFSNISDSIAQSNLKQTIENADKTLAKTAEIMSKINSGQGSLGALVKNDTLYYNLEKSTESLNKLLIDMKKNPKRYVHFSLFGGKEKEKN